jgi:hypothetical protein
VLGAAPFVNATGVHPEVLDNIAGSLLFVEFYLLVASPYLPGTVSVLGLPPLEERTASHDVPLSRACIS